MDKVDELVKCIIKHKALYYQGRPIISDNEFDELEDELRSLDPQNLVLSLVGSLKKGGGKVAHTKKMLSLNKTYSFEELLEWMSEKETVSSYKIDGVSCSLIYEKGNLKLGKTRGNGQVGEEISEKCKWIPLIPLRVTKKERIEVRGEIYCTKQNFLKLSDEMSSCGLERPVSHRNIVAGLISRKENIELCRYLSFRSFDLIGLENDVREELHKGLILKECGFQTAGFILNKGTDEIKKRIAETRDFMNEGPFHIDGLVFSFNDLSLHKSLGETAHHPRYKMAFKFKGDSKISLINKLSWTISRNGVYTPVAEIEPIELSGAIISRVTLHNYGLVKNKNLKSGDEIEIIRSGEVIPKFLRVTKSSSKEFKVPILCDYCDRRLVIREIRILCENEKCIGRRKEELLNFIQKIGIDDLSSKRLDELIKNNLVENIPDLYKLKKEDFLLLPKTREKLAEKLYESIQKTKDVYLAKFISSLGIIGGAINKSERIVNAGHDSIEKILSLTVEKLSKIDGFAEKSAMNYISSLAKKVPIIQDLLKEGFKIKQESSAKENVQISGKTFCITGPLSKKRSDIERMIKSLSGKISSTVSNKTSFLVCNDLNSSSSKFKKAIELDVKIISEKQLNDKIEEAQGNGKG